MEGKNGNGKKKKSFTDALRGRREALEGIGKEGPNREQVEKLRRNKDALGEYSGGKNSDDK